MPVRVTLPVSERSEAQVMWSKLVRLNALACTTSAYDVLLGEIRSTPALRADLVGTIEEACAVGQAEGAEDVDPLIALAELELAHDTLGSSMARDIVAGTPARAGRDPRGGPARGRASWPAVPDDRTACRDDRRACWDCGGALSLSWADLRLTPGMSRVLKTLTGRARALPRTRRLCFQPAWARHSLSPRIFQPC